MPMTGKQKSPTKPPWTYWSLPTNKRGWYSKTTCVIGATPMKNFDLSGTFDYTFFDSKEEAYAEWLRIDKENVVSQKATMSTSYPSGPTSLVPTTGNGTSQPLSVSTLRCG